MAILSRGRWGGAERRYARVASALISDGSDVRLYLSGDGFEQLQALRIEVPASAVRVLSPRSVALRPLNAFWSLLVLVRLVWYSRADRLSRMHFCVNPSLHSSIYSSLRPLVPRFSVSVCDAEVRQRVAERVSLTRQFVSTVRRAEAVDCLSVSIARHTVAISGFPAPTVWVAPCSFTDVSRVQEAGRRDIDVLFAARFVEGKGIEMLDEALHIIASQTGWRYSIHVCGFGPLKREFPGALVYPAADLFPILARTKIFLSIQPTENYPSQSLLEAMASGCAIVATDVGETRRLLSDESALLIPNSAMALVDAIQSLLLDEPRRLRLGEAARREASSHTVERYCAYFRSRVLGFEPGERSVGA